MKQRNEIQKRKSPNFKWNSSNPVTKCIYLVSSYQMENNACIGKVNKPIRFIKSKAGKDISRRLATESSIAKTSTAKKEESGEKCGCH